jgi:hypothetical protein
LLAIADPRAYVAGLNAEEKQELDRLLGPELRAMWLPDPRNEPQLQAYYSDADLMLYGGAAGGGKTDLLCGVALNNHANSVIFRKQSTDLRGIEDRVVALAGGDGWNGTLKTLRRGKKLLELGHLEKPRSEESWRGRPHDFIGFDEGAQLSKNKVRFVLGWLRSIDPKQRRRAIIASNPPAGGEGDWLLEWFAPWLDPKFARPAVQGELRWAATAPDRDGTTVWVPDGAPIVFTSEGIEWRYATPEEIAKGDEAEEVVQPQTRTFIQSLLRNNPYLANTGYRAQIQQLPEPLRSQLLNGDFVVGRQDHEWQVIPTAWVRAGQARWRPEPPEGALMSAMGVDVAQGGADRTVIAPRHGPWYAPVIERPGILTPTGSEVAALVVSVRRNAAVIVVDMGGGFGGGTKLRLKDNEIEVRPFNPAGESHEKTEDKQLAFYNKRSEAMWRLREALDPDRNGGSVIALPPDPQILADLTAPRWKLTTRGILVEPKEDLKKAERLGRSPDKGDAIILAWSEGEKGLVIAMKKAARSAASVPVKPRSGGEMPADRGTGWMRR